MQRTSYRICFEQQRQPLKREKEIRETPINFVSALSTHLLNEFYHWSHQVFSWNLDESAHVLQREIQRIALSFNSINHPLKNEKTLIKKAEN